MDRDVHNYQQAIDFLLSRINYERVSTRRFAADDLKLDRMQRLLSLLGEPHERIPAVHIAGTKGKGSTAMMTDAMLSAAGYRVGLFTSPHISRLEERMTVDGRPPSEEELVRLVKEVIGILKSLEEQSHDCSPTYFEILTALAWLYFRDRDVDVVVLEVGLGGRLDSTNLCRPEVTVITSISYDHTQILGATLKEIATEKAGILKPGIPLICGVTETEPLTAIEEIARARSVEIDQLGTEILFEYSPEVESGAESNAPLGRVDITVSSTQISGLALPVLGAHQAHNAALAAAACVKLREQGWRIPASAIHEGMRRLKCPARMELIHDDPQTIIDAAHNPASIRAVVETLQTIYPNRSRGLIFAASRDKPVSEMLGLLLPHFSWVVLTRYQGNPRGMDQNELQQLAQPLTDRPLIVAESPEQAWSHARKQAADGELIIVTGSFFIAAEIRDLLLPKKPDGIATNNQLVHGLPPIR